MIDFGLLVTFIVVVAAPAIFARLLPPTTFPRSQLLDIALGSLLIGLAVGRTVALTLDDRTALTQIRDILLIRSGVEFWPSVGAGIAALGWRARRANVQFYRRLADLAPYALVAYAAYEASCLARDGCYGPLSSVGFKPRGLTVTMLPLGLVAAAALLIVAVVVRQWSSLSTTTSILSALVSIAAVRSIASFWLPKIGDSLTRQHLESISVLIAGLIVNCVAAIRRGCRRGKRRRILASAGLVVDVGDTGAAPT